MDIKFAVTLSGLTGFGCSHSQGFDSLRPTLLGAALSGLLNPVFANTWVVTPYMGFNSPAHSPPK